MLLTLTTERTKLLEFDVDLLLNRNGNAREKRRIPVEFGQKLSHHFSDTNDVPAARFNVDLLLVVEVRLEPVRQANLLI